MKANEIIAKLDSFLVSGDKVFFTLQGEGPTIGTPAVFLRLHMCNLHCSWCDTKYTWDKTDKRYFSEPERWTFEKTREEISKYPCKRLVITGGEPLLHQKAISEFLYFIPDWEIEIETNGTILPRQLMSDPLLKAIQYNVSPKLANSGNDTPLRYRKAVLEAFNAVRHSVFKFVVQTKEDIEEVEKIVKDCGLHKEKIIIMPEGVSIGSMKKHGQTVAELCKEKGWRLIPRLQVFLWGASRKK